MLKQTIQKQENCNFVFVKGKMILKRPIVKITKVQKINLK